MYNNQVSDPEIAAQIARAQLKNRESVRDRTEDLQAWVDLREGYRSLIESLPTWEVQVCYFGNAVSPSSITYRTHGARVQKRIDFLPMSDDECPKGYVKQFSLNNKDAFKLLAECEDVKLQVSDTSRHEMFLFGWRELTTPEDFSAYEKDVKDAM